MRAGPAVWRQPDDWLSAVGVLADGGQGGLADRSRRPGHSRGRSSTAMEGLVLAGGALDLACLKQMLTALPSSVC